MAKNISLYKPNIPVTRNIYGVQTSGFMPEELEQIKDAASQKASKEKAKKEKKRKELEQKKAEEDRIRKANEKWVKNIKDQIAKAKSEGVDTSELEKQLAEYTKPKYHTDNVKIEDISTDVDMFPSDEEIQAVHNEAKNEADKKEISLPEFSIDDIKGIKSFEEMQKVDPKITKKDYQHAVNAWHIAQKVGDKIGVDPRLIFGQFGAETLFRDRSVLEQYNYGNIKHFDKSGNNVPQYEGQNPYTDNLNGSKDYYLRFNTIDEAVDWYAQRYAKGRHSLEGDAKTDPLAFSKSLYNSGYYEGDPNLEEVQRPIVYQRNIVSQANKWLSDDPLTAIQYKDDPYYTDPVEAIADSKEEPKKAKPLVNPYGQNVPLQGPKGNLAQPQFIRQGEKNLPKLSSGAGSLIYAGKQGQAYVETDLQKGLRTSNAALMGRGYNHPYEPIEITKRAGPHEMMDVNSVAGFVEKPVQKETGIIPGVQAYTTAPGNSTILSLDAINKFATEQRKIASAELDVKEEERKKEGERKEIDGLDKATTAANIINATNAAVGLGLGIYGASQINKMQRPSMISAPQIEAAKIRDTGAQAMAARKGMIEQSANTSREALRRAGRSDLNATITAGETRALNEAAGSIEGMRTNINAANVAAENRVREINASTKMQADQFNSQIQSAFNQFKSQLGSQNLSTTVQNISGNLGGIAQNIYAKELRLRDEKMQKYAIRVGAE